MAKERPLTPTTRTINYLADLGWMADEVERRLSRTLTMDLFGIFDVVAVKAGEPTYGIQCTTGDHHADRVHKLVASEKARTCCAAGWVCEVWSWREDKDGNWKLRTTSLRPETWPDV